MRLHGHGRPPVDQPDRRARPQRRDWRDNALPWRLPADLRLFKTVTMGKPMLMGRRTFDSIGRALPGRVNLVLTRDRAWQAPGTVAVHSLDEAFEKTQGALELMVIGGAELFKLVLPLAERIYLTDVQATLSGDTRFPDLAPEEWRELECSTMQPMRITPMP